MAESMFSNVYDARQKDLEGAVDYGASLAALPRGRVSVAVAGQSGGMLGQGLSSLAGALPPEQAQQAKIDELMSRFPNPTTYEDYMAIAGEFMTSGMQDMGEYFLKLANDMKTKTGSTNAYLDAKRERNELALRLQQGYGPMESLADKKAFKKQLIDNGVGDSSVFTSITGEINTLTTAGLAQDKDTDNRQQKLSTQMIKNGVPEIESALVEFEGLAAKYKNDLPGIGIDKWLLSKDAKDMKSAFAQVRNMVLKERSGAAVTNPEFQRLKEEIEGAMYTTDDDAIRWISRIRSTLERVKGTIFAGYGDRVKKAYWDTGTGVKMYEAPERKDMGIKIGDIRNGHKFLGGDPKDSKSWEKQ